MRSLLQTVRKAEKRPIKAQLAQLVQLDHPSQQPARRVRVIHRRCPCQPLG
jgi:hypothetical protein